MSDEIIDHFVQAAAPRRIPVAAMHLSRENPAHAIWQASADAAWRNGSAPAGAVVIVPKTDPCLPDGLCCPGVQCGIPRRGAARRGRRRTEAAHTAIPGGRLVAAELPRELSCLPPARHASRVISS